MKNSEKTQGSVINMLSEKNLKKSEELIYYCYLLEIPKNEIPRFIYKIFRNFILNEKDFLLINDIPININNITVLNNIYKLVNNINFKKRKIKILSKYEMEFIFNNKSEFSEQDIFLEDSDLNISLDSLITVYLGKSENYLNSLKF